MRQGVGEPQEDLGRCGQGLRRAAETVQGGLEGQAPQLEWEVRVDPEARKPRHMGQYTGQPQRGLTVAQVPRMVRRGAEGRGSWEGQVLGWAPGWLRGLAPQTVQHTGTGPGAQGCCGFTEALRCFQMGRAPGVVWGALDPQAPLRHGGLLARMESQASEGGKVALGSQGPLGTEGLPVGREGLQATQRV